jgi:hypothetical protein
MPARGRAGTTPIRYEVVALPSASRLRETPFLLNLHRLRGPTPPLPITASARSCALAFADGMAYLTPTTRAERRGSTTPRSLTPRCRPAATTLRASRSAGPLRARHSQPVVRGDCRFDIALCRGGLGRPTCRRDQRVLMGQAPSSTSRARPSSSGCVRQPRSGRILRRAWRAFGLTTSDAAGRRGDGNVERAGCGGSARSRREHVGDARENRQHRDAALGRSPRAARHRRVPETRRARRSTWRACAAACAFQRMRAARVTSRTRPVALSAGAGAARYRARWRSCRPTRRPWRARCPREAPGCRVRVRVVRANGAPARRWRGRKPEP